MANQNLGRPSGDGSKAPEPGGRFQKLALLSTVGLMIPIAITSGAAAGYYLDRRWGTFPWLSFVGFCFGVAAAFINLLRVLKKFDDDA
ncbi:MAG TPA: AtpZ/AtpI family protein [Vicinamibacteria bacterium]|nr:AtpZ/AtpI family protein [Vicinamibacteria bacterium]